MASGPNLPPQAYTRETLSIAFNWLQTQPESVRKQATTPDVLVGLYMRAQRFGGSSLETEAPVSSQAFMSDLKHLAEGLKQFEEPRSAHGQRRAMPPHAISSQQMQVPGQHVASASAAHHGQFHSHIDMNSEFSLSTETFQETPAPARANLNERSWAMIREVRTQLNLNSDVDAINMMVALAYKNLKNLLG